MQDDTCENRNAFCKDLNKTIRTRVNVNYTRPPDGEPIPKLSGTPNSATSSQILYYRQRELFPSIVFLSIAQYIHANLWMPWSKSDWQRSCRNSLRLEDGTREVCEKQGVFEALSNEMASSSWGQDGLSSASSSGYARQAQVQFPEIQARCSFH